MDPTDPHPSNPDVVLRQINEEPSSPMTTPKQVTNEHESRLSDEGLILNGLWGRGKATMALRAF